MKQYAVIDVGSNTIRLCVYEYTKDGLLLLQNRAIMARLGEKRKDGYLTDEGISAAVLALCELKNYIPKEAKEDVYVFATASLRNVLNTEDAVLKIYQKTGFSIEILSGEVEADFTFSGAKAEQGFSEGILADIGGGSSELVLFSGGEKEEAKSLVMGSLTARSKFVKGEYFTHGDAERIRSEVRNFLENHFSASEKKEIFYGIGGAVRAALLMEQYFAGSISGAVSSLENMLSACIENPKMAEDIILKASPGRLDTALPGLAMICEIASFFKSERLVACEGGVREGYLLYKISAGEKRNAE